MFIALESQKSWNLFIPLDKAAFPSIRGLILEQAHDKTYSKTCATSESLNQPKNPPSMARLLVHSSLNSPEAVDAISEDSD